MAIYYNAASQFPLGGGIDVYLKTSINAERDDEQPSAPHPALSSHSVELGQSPLKMKLSRNARYDGHRSPHPMYSRPAFVMKLIGLDCTCHPFL